jgi:hypothetical protein
MRRTQRMRAEPPASWVRRTCACLLAGAALPIALSLILFGYEPALFIPIVAGVVLLFIFMGGRPSPSWRGGQLGVIVFCNLIYLAAAAVSIREHLARVDGGLLLGRISKGLVVYQSEYGQFPDDLQRLVDERIIPPGLVMPDSADSGDYSPATAPCEGPCELNYICLPAGAPRDLVLVWMPRDYHGDAGGHVLYSDLAVRWVTTARLEQDLRRTEAWLAEHKRNSPTTSAGDR